MQGEAKRPFLCFYVQERKAQILAAGRPPTASRGPALFRGDSAVSVGTHLLPAGRQTFSGVVVCPVSSTTTGCVGLKLSGLARGFKFEYRENNSHRVHRESRRAYSGMT